MTFQIKNTKLIPCIQSSCKKARHSSLLPKNSLYGKKLALVIKDGAQSHTAKEMVRFTNQQQYLTLLQPNLWHRNSLDFSPFD